MPCLVLTVLVEIPLYIKEISTSQWYVSYTKEIEKAEDWWGFTEFYQGFSYLSEVGARGLLNLGGKKHLDH